MLDFHVCSLDVKGMRETRLNVELEPSSALPSYNTFFSIAHQWKDENFGTCEPNLNGNVYIPLKSDIDSSLSKLFEVLTSIMQLDSSCSSIILGDISIDLLKVSVNTRFME